MQSCIFTKAATLCPYRLIMGRAVLTGGIEVQTPCRRMHADINRSATEYITIEALLSEVTWLSFKEYKEAHEAQQTAVPVVPVNYVDASVCFACATQGAHKKCNRCKVAYYCDRTCQKAHWPVHKHSCYQHR